MATTIELREDGSLTLPSEALRELDLRGQSKIEWRIEDGRIILSPVADLSGIVGEDIPIEDKWAYTPEHLAAVDRARAGRAYTGMSEEFLLSLAQQAEARHRVGQALSREDIIALLEDAVTSGTIRRADPAA